MKSYSDLEGDGGSGILNQVVEQKSKIKTNLSGIKNMIAVASGKGGVGKSTISGFLAEGLRNKNFKVSVLDADFNGPSLSRMFGVQNSLMIPGERGLQVPKSKSGVGVLSFGTMVPETEEVDFDSVAPGDSYVWRATREFTTLSDILAQTDWGELDYLIIDLPPGAERCYQYAEFFGEQAIFILVTIPSAISRGVVNRSLSSLKKGKANVIGYVENMSGYYCGDCEEIKPLFPEVNDDYLDIPCLGKFPFSPEISESFDIGTFDIDTTPPIIGKNLKSFLKAFIDALEN